MTSSPHQRHYGSDDEVVSSEEEEFDGGKRRVVRTDSYVRDLGLAPPPIEYRKVYKTLLYH